jgi:hypothetical protein
MIKFAKKTWFLRSVKAYICIQYRHEVNTLILVLVRELRVRVQGHSYRIQVPI